MFAFLFCFENFGNKVRKKTNNLFLTQDFKRKYWHIKIRLLFFFQVCCHVKRKRKFTLNEVINFTMVNLPKIINLTRFSFFILLRTLKIWESILRKKIKEIIREKALWIPIKGFTVSTIKKKKFIQTSACTSLNNFTYFFLKFKNQKLYFFIFTWEKNDFQYFMANRQTVEFIFAHCTFRYSFNLLCLFTTKYSKSHLNFFLSHNVKSKLSIDVLIV